MYQDKKIWIGLSGEEKVYIYPKMANRHGLIAGATGTGKTITLKVMAESFSDCGVPVFLADVKGDLAGMCRPGADSEDMQARIKKFGLAEAGFDYHAYPATFWDVYAEKGLPLRTTVSEMGPLLLSRIPGLNEIQTDILTVAFRIADDEGLLLLDTKDLRALLQYLGEHSKEYGTEYGNFSKQSLGAVVRSLAALEAEGGDLFFGEGYVRVVGKGDKQRLVPIGSAARDKIQLYMEERKPKSASEMTLFLNNRGKPLTRAMVFNIIRQAAERAGITKNISPHTLRHSYATHLLQGGANIRQVHELLGHESITTTEVYTHLDRTHLRGVVEDAFADFSDKLSD